MRPRHILTGVVMTAAIVLMADTGSAEERPEFQITFEWSSQPTLTIRKDPTQDSAVMTIHFERYPLRRVPSLLLSMTEQGGVDVALVKVVNEHCEGKHAEINVTLQPMALGATGDALKHLHGVLDLREINIDASLATLSRAQLIELLRPSEAHPALNQPRNELNDAIELALPPDASEDGWVIEIQGYHYYGKLAK